MTTKTNLTLLFPRKLANQILTHAQHNPETEICGLVSAQNNHARHYYPVANTAKDTTALFKMDEQAQIAAMKNT